MPFLQLFAGLALLGVGAELLVRGASGLAVRMGISALVVGLTVVAFGTGSPELVVSVRDALGGEGQIALGTVIGSNISNIVFILGAASVVRPVRVHLQVLKVDLPVLVAVTILVAGFVLLGTLSRGLGALLLGGLIAYSSMTIWLARHEKERQLADQEFGKVVQAVSPPLPLLLGMVAAGCALLAYGSGMMLRGATTIASLWGVSEAVIGLTLVAVGSSLPELATSLVAAFKGDSDIAVGNVVGSNIFNLLGVLGAAALTRPLTATQISLADLGMMTAMTVLAVPLMYTDYRISRLEGVGMLIAYAAYVSFLFFCRG